MKRIVASLVLVCIIVSCAVCLPALVDASPVTYSSEYNSGTRGDICTSLSGTGASDYYTGDYTYEKLSGLSDDALKSSLSTLMTTTHSYISSYDDCHYMADRIDCENEDGRVSLIYTSYSATMDQWNGWNREHVWPQSLGGDNTKGGGADLHHIRPSDAGVNSSRGNKKYGESGSNPSKKYGSDPAVGVLGGTYNSTYFEPLDNVKGDVARICLYVHIRWGSDWGASDITSVFQSVDILLEWCELDPVDTWEMGRNEVVQDIQGNRNVFIDYPELAWLIFDEEIPNDMVTPSGMAMNNGDTSTGDKETEKATEKVTEKATEEATEDATEGATDTAPGEDEQERGGIIATNIYFDDTLRFMFASAVKPTITFTDDFGKLVSLEVKPFIQNGEQVEVNGYPAWISSAGVAAQGISKRITVTAGNRTETYSVLEYLYTRLYVSTNVTATERYMHETLIEYARKADICLNGVAESDIGTEYLVRVTNGTIDGMTASDLFAKNETPFENISADASVSSGEKPIWQVSVTTDGVTTTATYTDEQIRELAIVGHTVVTAIGVEEEPPAQAHEWKLVTDISQLSVGDQIIITANEYDFALSNTQNNNNRGQTAVTKNGDLLDSPSSSVQIITLEKGAVDGSFAFYTGDAGYLYAASSSKNYLRTETTLDANGSWSITVSADGIATVVSQGSHTRNILKYNKGNSLFSCYGSTSSNIQDISIYVLTE